MTLSEIKATAAAYLGKATGDLTVNSVDLFLVAANQARRAALMGYDFEFTRVLADLSVNGVSGAALASAVLSGTSTSVELGTILDVGLFNDGGDFVPVEWTTTAESLERQRQENPYGPELSVATDWDYVTADPILHGRKRVTLSGGYAYVWPRRADTTFSLGVEAYSVPSDWAAADLSATGVTVTGTLVPNATGSYVQQSGNFNGAAWYTKIGTNPSVSYILFYNGANYVFQALQFGTELSNVYWQKTVAGTTVAGTYNPQEDASGVATVTGGAGTSDTWTTQGQQYLLWSSVVQLNYKFKTFVPRQEGNLLSPTELMNFGLESLKQWDMGRFEQNRRHGR